MSVVTHIVAEVFAHFTRPQRPGELYLAGSTDSRNDVSHQYQPPIARELRRLRGSEIWLAMNREGTTVARCTVERLLGELDLRGAVGGRIKRTTIVEPAGERPADLVSRRFAPAAPNRLRVAGITYVSTWSGWVYVAFVVDAYARRIIGWRTSTSMTTALVLDAIEHAIWIREHVGRGVKDVFHHADREARYTSIALTERLAEAGIQPSVGAVGFSYDNAPAKTINGLFKIEVINHVAPGAALNRSSARPLNGSTGSLTAVSTGDAVKSHRPRREAAYCSRQLAQYTAELSRQ